MRIHSEDLKIYPDGLKEFPSELMSEKEAQRNHSQSLEGLNRRGGMSYYEIYCNLRGRGFEHYKKTYNYCKEVTDVLNASINKSSQLLTVDNIKSIFKYFPDIEGFKFHYDPIASKCGGGWLEYYDQKCTMFGLQMPHSIIFELFLSRVIEAINKTDKYVVDLEYYCDVWLWRVFEGEFVDEDSFLEMGNNKGIDQSKLYAILYILNQIESKEVEG